MTAATELDSDLDAAFDALADRTRRGIVIRLTQGEATVGELAEPFDLTHQAVSRHVGILRSRGLIDQRIDGQKRPCRLNVDRLQELADWIIEQRRAWESHLDHQRRPPPDLRAEQAPAGLTGILERLDAVVAELSSDQEGRT